MGGVAKEMRGKDGIDNGYRGMEFLLFERWMGKWLG